MSYKKSVAVGGKTLTIETGKIAKQANASVVVSMGDTVVLVVAVADLANNNPLGDFLPLTVNYIEKTYAAGKMPGGFLKRESRLSDSETLTARMTDRPLRPLFPASVKCPIDVITQVLSADPEVPPETLSMIGASAALTISDIPFNGPIGAVKIGRINGEFVVNPVGSDLLESDLDLTVAASDTAILMVEAGADHIIEEDMLKALQFAHDTIKPMVELQKQMQTDVGKVKHSFAPVEALDAAIIEKMDSKFKDVFVAQVLSIPEKLARYAAKKAFKSNIKDEFNPDKDDLLGVKIGNAFHDLEYKYTRALILDDKKRIGGRAYDEIRKVECETNILPRVHGSSLFTRGETQAIVTATLGTGDDEQRYDDLLTGQGRKSFYLHYNFPGYSVGECKRMGPPGRREIGHGALAERALAAALPDKDTFPYTVRIVSEITESNGSSSMASVCGGSLALLAAGVPLKNPIAGIAMGLIKEGEKTAILTDILGDEDHLGDMDFKVCGSKDHITALQMDIKIEGISIELMREALQQAKNARVKLLTIMEETISTPHALSEYAPRIEQIKINPEKVRDLIGPGGKNIRRICEETGAKIDIEDDGIVNVSSPDGESLQRAIAMVQDVVFEPVIGAVYMGKVTRIEDYGCFVELRPGVTGLVHISNLDKERVNKVRDIVNDDDECLVKVIDIDNSGRLKLSRKEALGQKPSS